jgi:hypothetical protein
MYSNNNTNFYGISYHTTDIWFYGIQEIDIINKRRKKPFCKEHSWCKYVFEIEYIKIEDSNLVKSLRSSSPTKQIVEQFQEYEEFYNSVELEWL